jgi:hypothetical protein
MSRTHPRNIQVERICLLVGVAASFAGEARVLAADVLLVAFRYQVNSTVQGCPGETEVRKKIGQQLGYDPFVADANDQVTFQIESRDEKGHPRAAELRGRVVWTDRAGNGKGERRFSSRDGDCAQLSRDMAFAAAVQIQLLATGETTAAPVTATPTTPAPAPHPTAQPGEPDDDDPASAAAPARRVEPLAKAAPPAPEPTPPAHRSLLVGGGSSMAWGLTPEASVAGRVFAAVLSAPWVVALGGEATLLTTTRDSDGAGFSARAILVTAAGCYHASYLLACGVGKLGQMHVQGTGVDAPRSPTSLLAQAGPRLALLWPLGDHFFVLGLAEGLVAIDRPTVLVNYVEVWTASRFAALAGVDVGLRFP